MPAYQSVLIVEDSADTRSVLDEVLRYEGVRTFLAANGVEALETLPRLPRPALILLDLKLPQLDGAGFLDVLERMPERGEFSVVVMSGSSFADALKNRPGVVQVLKKPFDIAAFLACIRRSLNDEPQG